MKTLFLALTLVFMLDGVGLGAITERIIYAGDTPLINTCTVVQSGPMELTIAPCSFTTTGQAKVFSVLESLPAQVGLGALAKALREGKAEWFKGNRVRAWLRDENGEIIERAKTRRLVVPSVLTVPDGNTYFIYLVEKVGPILEVVLLPITDPRPAEYVHYLAFEFMVPLGTTDLNGIKIEVFTVRPGHTPAKGLFKK
jgi:hypothetical protein